MQLKLCMTLSSLEITSLSKRYLSGSFLSPHLWPLHSVCLCSVVPLHYWAFCGACNLHHLGRITILNGTQKGFILQDIVHMGQEIEEGHHLLQEDDQEKDHHLQEDDQEKDHHRQEGDQDHHTETINGKKMENIY